MTATATTIPTAFADPVNRTILEVSEDRIVGFDRDPLGTISRLSGVGIDTVIARLRAMLEAGTIRRIRQTLQATNLAQGALVAWKIDPDRIDAAFDFLFQNDPFTGHVVVRNADAMGNGTAFRLWTTLKVPTGYSIVKHCDLLKAATGATAYRIMPPLRVFTLGVGHMRRKGLEIGARSPEPADPREPAIVQLDEEEWRVLCALKRDFTPDEIVRDLWAARAVEAGVDDERFFRIAEGLDRKKVIGRFSTFLEHVKHVEGSGRLTQFNALFHWAVPDERVLEAGSEIGRHLVLTHCYWRDGGPELNNVNIMAVAHGTDQENVLAHKAAIDEHVRELGIPILHSTIYWGGRSEIKPSEISPAIYAQWCRSMGVAPESLRD